MNNMLYLGNIMKKFILIVLTILTAQPLFAGQTASSLVKEAAKTDPRLIAAAIAVLTYIRDQQNAPKKVEDSCGVPQRDPKEKSKTRLAYEAILFAEDDDATQA